MQEKEILRREELQATVHKSADAEKYASRLCEAYRLKLQTAAGKAGEADRGLR
jgi:hypothetical protein